MKKIKHSKFKNTAMLFELLTRQITSDIISSNESVAIQILKKFFNKNTELIKEYRLYKTLSDERFKSDTKANMLIEAALKARRGLNKNKLQNEKYELIKTIKENFEIDSFFQTKVNNYKLLASIYKIFEYNELDNPVLPGYSANKSLGLLYYFNDDQTKVTLYKSGTHNATATFDTTKNVTYTLNQNGQTIIQNVNKGSTSTVTITQN
jgi:hypothetical protein